MSDTDIVMFVDTYAIVLFFSVILLFGWLVWRHPKLFLTRSGYVGFHMLSLGIFIIYMYESGEYTNDEVHPLAKKLGVSITNRSVGIAVILGVLGYTIFKSVQMTA